MQLIRLAGFKVLHQPQSIDVEDGVVAALPPKKSCTKITKSLSQNGGELVVEVRGGVVDSS